MKLSTTVLVIVIASLLTTSVDSSSRSEKIVNGHEADEGEFPFVVSVTLNDEHICGGFIYSPKHVITAASCVIGKDPYDMAVVVAQLSLIQSDPGEDRIQAVGFDIHPNYSESTRANDLALITLSPLITYGPNVDFCYYDSVDESTYATIIGWGAVQQGGIPSTKLLKANVSLPADCRLYGSEEYDYQTMICAGDSTQDFASPCDYDEGSPLVQDGMVVGIMSKNRGCGDPFPPTIYTRLVAFFSWITSIAGQQPIPGFN